MNAQKENALHWVTLRNNKKNITMSTVGDKNLN